MSSLLRLRILKISSQDLDILIHYSTHTSAGIKLFFSPFLTRSLSYFLSDCDYSFDEVNSLSIHSISRNNLLYGLNLSGMDLSGLDFSGLNLSFHNFSGSNLSNTNLRGSNLRDSNLRDSNLSGADMSGTNLISANLRDANLICAKLLSANLFNAKLLSANLSSVNMRDADLRDAKFSGANCQDAITQDAIFTGADLQGVQNLDLQIPTTERLIDQYFNHRANRASLLTTIHSIRDLALKISLMESLITKIEALEPAAKSLVLIHSSSFYSILCTTSDYRRSPIILNFIKTTLLSAKIAESNAKVTVFTPIEQEMLVTVILDSLPSKEFCIENRVFLAQLIYSLKSSSEEKMKEHGNTIEAVYLSHFPAPIEPVVERLDSGGLRSEEDLSSALE